MKKLFTSMFLVLVLLIMTAGTAFAQVAIPITGTVQSVTLQIDASTGETTVAVTVLDETTGVSQTVTLSLTTAQSLGLVTSDPNTGDVTVAADAVGKSVQIDPATILPTGDSTTDEKQHPVGSALSDFFSGLLGADYETIMTAHHDGVGFGVIAQALWLTNEVGGDSSTFEALIQAKQSGDYSEITLADGSTPDNWGDVVKSLKKGDNLGSVMSGKAEAAASDSSETITTDASVNGKGHGNSNNGKDHGNDNGNDNNGNGHGGGRP